MFEIKSGVARPTPAPQAGPGEKYPTSRLGVGDHFVVPKSEMKPGEEPQKFRNRVNQAVRTYKQRVNASAHLEPGYDETTYVPVSFSILLLDAPKTVEQDWEEGDVGVWRDS